MKKKNEAFIFITKKLPNPIKKTPHKKITTTKTTNTGHIPLSTLRTCNDFSGKNCRRDHQYRVKNPRHFHTGTCAPEWRVLSTALQFESRRLIVEWPREWWMWICLSICQSLRKLVSPLFVWSDLGFFLLRMGNLFGFVCVSIY